MSLAERIIITAFTVIAVGLSYDFEPQLAAWLGRVQPHLTSLGVSLEASAIIVVPTVLFATFIIRQVRRTKAENA